MKTLTVILHYNTPQYTDQLYEMLKDNNQSEDCDLIVVDNNSDVNKKSKYTTHTLEENIYFGGGLNASMELILENESYDSLLFLNNDLIVGKNFIKSLRREALNGWNVLSPCIIQPEKTQNHWQQMLCWNTGQAREVRWADQQAILISRKFINHLKNTSSDGNLIDPLLIRGWGIDVLFGIICEKQGWKTCVCDNIPAIHLGSMTMKSIGNTNDYCRLAERGMMEFFQKNQLMNEFNEMRKWGENYKIL